MSKFRVSQALAALAMLAAIALPTDPVLAQVDPTALARAIQQNTTSVTQTGSAASNTGKIIVGFVALIGVFCIGIMYTMGKYKQESIWKWVGGAGTFLLGSAVVLVVWGVS